MTHTDATDDGIEECIFEDTYEPKSDERAESNDSGNDSCGDDGDFETTDCGWCSESIIDLVGFRRGFINDTNRYNLSMAGWG